MFKVRSALAVFVYVMVMLTVTLLLIPANANALRYQAVMAAPDYPGGPAFDDNLSLSRATLAGAFSTWANWRRGPGGNIVELPGNTNRAVFLNSFTPFLAGGGSAMQAGDLFVLFYFGHGSYVADVERPPAFDRPDETLFFPNGTFVTDDELKTTLAQFNPGVFKLFIDVSCFSGGMWNGNDPGGAGDLDQVARTILMSSSREFQSTFAGGLPPRTWEPIYLRNLINTALFADHRRSVSIAEYHARSAATGSAINASRFASPGDAGTEAAGNDLWAILVSGDFDSEIFSNIDQSVPPDLFVPIPEPSTLLLLGLGLAGLVMAGKKKWFVLF